MCGNCAYYVDNLFYGYQVYCTLPTEYWLNPLGYAIVIIAFIFLLISIFNKYKK